MPKPFFPTLLIGGAPVSFDHLEPFQFTLETVARPHGAIVDVRFSNHCFSESYDADRHPDPVINVWDRGQRRVFDQVRYDLSLGLRGVVEALGSSPVYHTPESNFVRIVAPGGNGEAEYRVYFNTKRGDGAHDIAMYVESAYPSDFARQVLKPSQMTKVRFALLVDKTIRGEKLKFQHKR